MKNNRYETDACKLAAMAMGLLMVLAPLAQAADPAPAQIISDKIVIEINKGYVYSVGRMVKKANILTSEIADVQPLNPSTLLVSGKKAGSTELVITDENDKSQVVDVLVQSDMTALRGQLTALLPDSRIDVTEASGAIALRGEVANVQASEQALALATPYGGHVLNFLSIAGGKQIMLHVRFAEVSKSATSELGINIFNASGAYTGGSNIGQVSPITALPPFRTAALGATPPPNGLGAALGHTISSATSLYGAGQIGNFYLEYFIDALRSNNLLRTLAEPDLIATSGQEASFLAGGEFPIPVTQGGASAGAVTIDYRSFGVKLNFTPIALGDGRIRLKINPEVSDIDFSTAVKFNGFLVPGLTTRKVATTVELGEGETFAIAGLLSNDVAANSQTFPYLGDMPVLGALFRSVSYTRKESELVVLVTPYFVEGMTPAQVGSVPGEKWRHPKENDLFWFSDLGGDLNDVTGPTAPQHTEAAPKFQGEYGFRPASTPHS